MMYGKIKCPYCGHIQKIDNDEEYMFEKEILESGYYDITCEKCDGTFEIYVEIEYEPEYKILEIKEYKEERERLKDKK